MRGLRALIAMTAYAGTAWVGFLFARDTLAYGAWSAPVAALLAAGLLPMAARIGALEALALRRPLAADVPRRLFVGARLSLVSAMVFACVCAPRLCTLAGRYGAGLSVHQWEAALLGLLAAYVVFVAGVVMLEGLAALAGNRALAHLAATDPEGWVFASDALAAARRQAGKRLGGLLRGVLGCGVFVVLYAGGTVGLSLGPAVSLAGAALAAAAGVALTSCRVPRQPRSPLEPLEPSPCMLNGVHEWDGATCRRCGARRRRREGQLV